MQVTLCIISAALVVKGINELVADDHADGTVIDRIVGCRTGWAITVTIPPEKRFIFESDDNADRPADSYVYPRRFRIGSTDIQFLQYFPWHL